MRTLVHTAVAALLALPPLAVAQTGAVPTPATPTPAPAAAAVLTLEDAIALARQHNPTFLSIANNRRTADAAVRSARGAFLPSADASLGGRYQQGGTQVFNGLNFSNSSATLQSSYSLNLNYRLNSATFVQPRAAVANRHAVEADIVGNAEQLRAAVTQQYLTVLQAEARSALQDTLVGTARAQLELAQAKMAVGSGTILDVRRAEVTVGQAEVALLTARNAVQVERLRLYQQMGVPQPPDVALVTQFRIETPTVSLEQLLDLARAQHPAIVALRARERAADLNTKVARAEYTPTLALSTGWGGNSYQYVNGDFLVDQARNSILSRQISCIQQDSIRIRVGLSSADCTGAGYQFTDAQAAAIRDRNDQFPFRFQRSPLAFTASLSVPIFNNFNREERVQRAEVDRDDAMYNVRAKDLALTADVTQAYLTLMTDVQTVALQEQNAAKAKEELTYAEERYKVGLSTFLDVTTSRDGYERALIDRVNAVYDYHKAFAALENAVGRPLR